MGRQVGGETTLEEYGGQSIEMTADDHLLPDSHAD